MENDKIGLGVIGSGYIAKKVLKDIKSECDYLAIYSRNSSTAKKLAVSFDADVFDNLDLFLHNDKINCVYIATPHPAHYNYIRQTIDSGIAVICEKPLVMNTEQFSAVKRLADEKNIFFTEIMWFRYSPLFLKLNEILKTGAMGGLKKLNINIGFDAFVLPKRKRLLDLEAGGGALLDIGVYMLSVFEFLFGDAILNCDAEINTEFSDRSVDIYDHIRIKLDGVICDFECSLKSVLPTELTAEFDRGTIKIPMFFRPRKMIITVGEKVIELMDEFSYKKQFVSNFKTIQNGATESSEYPHSSIFNTLSLMDKLREKSGIMYCSNIEKA